MKMWTKFGCFLTGWSSAVLAQCSEASKCQLSKYTSALLILIIIWGVTGFCFAQRYMNLPFWGCCLVSLSFVTIVIMIERQIILTTEKSFWMVLFRGIIALIMAVVGSTIFDQTMFGKDIDKQMANTIENQVVELSKKRVRIIDDKIAALHKEIDSLSAINYTLQEEINLRPFITQKTITNTTNTIVVDGEIKKVNTPSVTTNQIINPKQAQLDSNNKTVASLREQELNWVQKKQNVEEDVRTECKSSVGFLEEIEAMWTIITTRKLAGVFYLIFFCLLMSLELFVVISKILDKECDYEIAMKGAQKVRILQFTNAFSRSGINSI